MAQPTNNGGSGKSTKSVLYTYLDSNGDAITVYNDGTEALASSTTYSVTTLASNKDSWSATGSSSYEIFANNNGDTLNGSGVSGAVALFGANGKDLLKGGTGNSYLDGGNAPDVLVAGGGKTILVGGLGSDLLE